MSRSSAGGRRSTRPSQRADAARAADDAAPVRLRAGVPSAGHRSAQRPVRGRGASRRSPSSDSAHESRAKPGGRAQVRRRLGQVPQQRQHVLDLVGVEEPEPLVDVGPQPARLERVLELAVALAGPEQDGDVAGPDRPRHAGRRGRGRRAVRSSSRAISAAVAAAHDSASAPAIKPEPGLQRRTGRQLVQREPIVAAVGERVGAVGHLVDVGADVVDERQQRRHRAEAAR